MESFKACCSRLESKIIEAYSGGVTLDQAEKLAGEFLYAQLRVSTELTNVDLDSRMRKSGVKAVKAAIYLENATKSDKKPSDVMLAAMVDSHEVVQSEQDSLDKAEVSKAELERLYDIFGNSHIYFRGIAKSNFNG